jgi:hypothetical protein
MRPTFAPAATPAAFEQPHWVEREVHRRLTAHPGLRLQSLVVHRTRDGVCLEGRVQLLEPELNLHDVLNDIDGVGEVINHLMPAAPSFTPEAAAAFDDGDELRLGYHQG